MRLLIALLVLGLAVSLATPAAVAEVLDVSAAIEVVEDAEPEVDAVAAAAVVWSVSPPSAAAMPGPDRPPYPPAAPPPVPPPER